MWVEDHWCPDCPEKARNKDKSSKSSSTQQIKPTHITRVSPTHKPNLSPSMLLQGKAGNKPATILLDTGANLTLVQKDLVPDERYSEGFLNIRVVNDNIFEIPKAKLNITAGNITHTLTVGVRQSCVM